MDINSSVGGGGSAGTGGVGGTLLVGCVPNVTGGGGGSSQNLSLSSPNNENPSPNLNLYKSTCLSPQQSSATQQTYHQQQQQPTTSSSAPSSTNNDKYECEKCNLTFPRHDIYKEHQLIHLMNPNLLLNQQLMNPNLVGDNSPFSLLQNMTNAAAAAGNLLATTTSENNENSGATTTTTGTTVDLTMQKKRKLSESSDTDLFDLKSLNKKYKNDQYDLLYNYYMQNEKNQKLMVSPTLRNSKSPALDPFGGEKPPIEFLFQYYQINESKKFFQLDLPLAATNNADADLMASFNRRHKPPSLQDTKADNLNQLHRIATQDEQQLHRISSQDEQQLHRIASQVGMQLHRIASQVGMQQQQPPRSTSNSMQSKGRGGGAGASKIGESPAATTSSNASLDSFNDQNQDIFNASGSGIASSRSPDQSTSSTPMTTAEKQNNKRLRTTILPEQLNFLYECYQNESNPSRKMLEEISKKVNLKKRVVQVCVHYHTCRRTKIKLINIHLFFSFKFVMHRSGFKTLVPKIRKVETVAATRTMTVCIKHRR